jgi:hypothetical protein
MKRDGKCNLDALILASAVPFFISKCHAAGALEELDCNMLCFVETRKDNI